MRRRKSPGNGLFTVSAYHEEKLIGMGRLVGDGSMYWYIQDVAVLPEYQRKGIGSAIVESSSACAGQPDRSLGFHWPDSRKGKEPFYEKTGIYKTSQRWMRRRYEKRNHSF